MVKKIQINLGNKTFYTLIIFLAVLIIGGIVYAYNSSPANPAIMGHTSNEVLNCSRVSTGWISLINGNTYSATCPANKQGIVCLFDFYDTNGGFTYHGAQMGNWNPGRTVCSITIADAGISAGSVSAECC
jgi:hypothetical protein